MRIVQISDLHFGRVRADLTVPLAEAMRAAAPDLVVMAGDFVQRARDWQFREARAFMDGLDLPWMAVPGNHDIPLFNVFARVFAPYRGYRRWIAHTREPVVETPDAVVLGLDTTDPMRWQRGRVRKAQIDRACRVIEAEAGRRTVLIAAHHPFHHRPEIEKKLMISASDALETWADCGPNVILTGHLHSWLVEPFVTRKGGRQTLQVHAGTGLSSRVRGEPNDFAVLDIEGARIDVTRMVAPPERLRFESAGTDTYERGADGWSKIAEGLRDDRA